MNDREVGRKECSDTALIWYQVVLSKEPHKYPPPSELTLPTLTNNCFSITESVPVFTNVTCKTGMCIPSYCALCQMDWQWHETLLWRQVGPVCADGNPIHFKWWDCLLGNDVNKGERVLSVSFFIYCLAPWSSVQVGLWLNFIVPV